MLMRVLRLLWILGWNPANKQKRRRRRTKVQVLTTMTWKRMMRIWKMRKRGTVVVCGLLRSSFVLLNIFPLESSLFCLLQGMCSAGPRLSSRRVMMTRKRTNLFLMMMMKIKSSFFPGLQVKEIEGTKREVMETLVRKRKEKGKRARVRHDHMDQIVHQQQQRRVSDEYKVQNWNSCNQILSKCYRYKYHKKEDERENEDWTERERERERQHD